MAKGDDIEDRLIKFAVRVIHLCRKLPKDDFAVDHMKKQLIRSATSPAPNYAEARGAESTNDFIHKLKIALKELNETRVWLKMMIQAEFVKEKQMNALLDECDQLCRILSTSIHTARTRQKS